MAKVHNFLIMLQGSNNLHATQTANRAQTKQTTAIGYILNTEEILKASSLLFQQDGAAAFESSIWSPLLPGLSAKNLSGWRTQKFTVHQIRRTDCHPLESHEDTKHGNISNTEKFLTWKDNLDIPTDTEDNCITDIEADTEQDNYIEDPESPGQQDVSTAPDVPRLICPTWKSKR